MCPALNFTYHAIFTRILSNDNIFKGLSTFGVEMSELNIILRRADQYSLVLGDELVQEQKHHPLLLFVCPV